jgi:hypothetical protein
MHCFVLALLVSSVALFLSKKGLNDRLTDACTMSEGSVGSIDELIEDGNFRGKFLKLTTDAKVNDLCSDEQVHEDRPVDKLEILDTYNERYLIAMNMVDGT